MTKICQIITILLTLICWTGSAWAMSIDEILSAIQKTQSQVMDMQAYYSQKMTSNLLGDKSVIEQGKITCKGNKTRKDIQSPGSKLSITTPEFLYEKDNTTGIERKTDLTAEPPQANMMPSIVMSPEEALAKYQFIVKNDTPTSCILIGNSNSAAIKTKIIMTIAKNIWAATDLILFMNDKEILKMNFEYVMIDQIPVLKKTIGIVKVSMGTAAQSIETQTEYSGIKINQSVSDDMFRP